MSFSGVKMNSQNTKHVLKIEADSNDPAIKASFEEAIKFAHTIIFNGPWAQDLDATLITASLNDDFIGAVRKVGDNQHIKSPELDAYDTERFGGTVAAKTMPITDDHKEVRILFNGQLWTHGDDRSKLIALKSALHEMAHALIGTLRWQSGALDGVTFPSRTPAEYARSIVRIAAEECRVEMLCALVLSKIATTEKDGVSRPIRPTDLEIGFYRDRLKEILDSKIHPGWPDLIQSYREYQIPLDKAWLQIVNETGQALTLLAFCEAEAESLERQPPLFDELEQHRGAKLYLAPAWGEVSIVLKSQSVIPGLQEFKDREIELLDVGERAVFSIWRSLGLTFDIRPDKSYGIKVQAPHR